MTAPDLPDEGTLIRMVQTGSRGEAEAAFEQLVARHGSHLFVHLRAKGLTTHEQEDIASETWLRAYRKIGQFRYKGVDLFPWLRRIADLVTKEYSRTRYLGEPLEDDSGTEEALAAQDPAPLVVRQLTQDELQKAFADALQEAPADYRDLINAKFFVGFNASEIGEYYGWSMPKVYTTSHRAIAWLRQKLLERYGQDVIRDWLA